MRHECEIKSNDNIYAPQNQKFHFEGWEVFQLVF